MGVLGFLTARTSLAGENEEEASPNVEKDALPESKVEGELVAVRPRAEEEKVDEGVQEGIYPLRGSFNV